MGSHAERVRKRWRAPARVVWVRFVWRATTKSETRRGQSVMFPWGRQAGRQAGEARAWMWAWEWAWARRGEAQAQAQAQALLEASGMCLW